MKMRHWQSTHDRNRLIGKKDIGIEGDEVKADVLKSDPLNSTISYSSNPSFVNDANRELEISNSYDHEHIRSYYGSKPISLFLILEKDVNQVHLPL
jgi:hypothetical protein